MVDVVPHPSKLTTPLTATNEWTYAAHLPRAGPLGDGRRPLRPDSGPGVG
jgi:hypothetical protein